MVRFFLFLGASTWRFCVSKLQWEHLGAVCGIILSLPSRYFLFMLQFFEMGNLPEMFGMNFWVVWTFRNLETRHIPMKQPNPEQSNKNGLFGTICFWNAFGIHYSGKFEVSKRSWIPNELPFFFGTFFFFLYVEHFTRNRYF